jgi:hypothetical protein
MFFFVNLSLFDSLCKIERDGNEQITLGDGGVGLNQSVDDHAPHEEWIVKLC